jgi:hypothetical protein
MSVPFEREQKSGSESSFPRPLSWPAQRIAASGRMRIAPAAKPGAPASTLTRATVTVEPSAPIHESS